jgi:hypothetical protein
MKPILRSVVARTFIGEKTVLNSDMRDGQTRTAPGRGPLWIIKSRSTAATDFLDDCATVVTLLDDDSAATTNVHTHAMMPMAMAVAVAITTDTDVNARAVATPTNPRAFTLPATHSNATAPAFTAPFAPITIAALAALGTGPFARLSGLRGLTRRRTALSPGRAGASRRLGLRLGVL